MQKYFSLFIIISCLNLSLTAANANPKTGFEQPFNGTPRYAKFAAPKADKKEKINKPIGRRKADQIARALGLRLNGVFTPKQYALLISGKGIGGDPEAAALIDKSVRLLTNTKGRPLHSVIDGEVIATELASYGLFVDPEGLLKSCANLTSPSRQINALLVPGGYVWEWSRANGAKRVVQNIYASAYPLEAIFGALSQSEAGIPQLVQNRRNIVGMSMVPSIWIVNFELIYILNPKLAAKMPAYWTPIPQEVAEAIEASPDGQVPYSEFMQYLPPVGD